MTGHEASDVRRVAVPDAARAADGQCPDCGNGTFADGYCTACGNRRSEPDREEAQLGRIAMITDRGLEHGRNEDAAAAGILAAIAASVPDRPYGIAVAVCDGVSSSKEAQRAAVAASTAGVEAMLVVLARLDETRPAVVAGLTAAAKAAAAAGPPTADPDSAPSCTYTAAAMVLNSEGAVHITVGNVGDSRVYWLPEPPGAPQQLTVDDSVAQELITAGAGADSEAVRRGAHTLTRWLGADAEPRPWADWNVYTTTTVDPGWLVLCTDGLWNYLPDAADLAQLCTGSDPLATARTLVEYALAAGGNDNITVAVLPIGGVHEFS
jgi:serine/threonine protein phosphatase PrpC